MRMTRTNKSAMQRLTSPRTVFSQLNAPLICTIMLLFKIYTNQESSCPSISIYILSKLVSNNDIQIHNFIILAAAGDACGMHFIKVNVYIHELDPWAHIEGTAQFCFSIITNLDIIIALFLRRYLKDCSWTFLWQCLFMLFLYICRFEEVRSVLSLYIM